MKFTSEELAKLLGIKIGDKIRLSNGEIVEVVEDYLLDYHPRIVKLPFIVNREFEIVQPKKKTGDLICTDISCSDCPLYRIICMDKNNVTLYEALDNWYKNCHDKEIYDILKTRLDKEVKDE